MADSKKMMADVDKAIEEVKRMHATSKDSNAVVSAITEKLVAALTPVFEKMAADVGKQLASVKIDVPKFEIPPISVEMPPINMPEVKVPMAQVHVNVPDVVVPEIRVPDVIMPDHHETTLRGIGPKNPLPMMMYGTDGKPFMFPIPSGGGKGDFFTIKNILTELGNSVMDNTNNAINVSIVSSSGLTISTSGTAVSSTNVIQLGGNAIATDSGITGAGVQRIVHATDVAVSTYFTDQALAMIIKQLSGTSDSVEISGQQVSLLIQQLSGANFSMEIASQPFTLDVKQVSGGSNSIEIASQPFTLDVKQVSGSSDSVAVINSVEVKQVSGFNYSVEIASQPFTLDVKQVSGGSNSVELASQQISLGVFQASGFNYSVEIASQQAALQVRQVSDGNDSVTVVGFNSTAMVIGSVVADTVDDGSAPLKDGGIARQTNPTAVADGDRVAATYDDLGRQVMRLTQVRDLMQTAYVALSTGTETTLLAGAASTFYDLVYIMAANDSGAAVQVDIRAATGANKVMTIEVPANGTAGVSLPVPLPQDIAAATWTADLPDITGTNVYISALFSKEV